ncbi:MAG: efflux transporter outer membrane subunit [Proteobacteria bacterium]|nr:efflux transporter outer membrane subunit [Pseudomonadota bacterium]
MKFYFKINILSLFIALTGCAVGPDYKRPETETPAKFKEGWIQTAPVKLDGAWWTVFNDATLDALEARVAIANQSLKASFYTYRQTQAASDAARAAEYPTLGATVSSTRTSSGGVSSTTGATTTTTVSGKSAGFTASWVPDLWGKVRRQVEFNQASSEASLETLHWAQLSLQGTLAQDYFLIRQLDSQTALAQDTVAAYEKALQITHNRYQAGVATQADVALAESQLATARVQHATFGVQRAQLEHAIAVLTGQAPAGFSLPPMPGLEEPRAIPASLPSQLLLRRPDVRAAERQVAAANAQIGVSKSAYFPALTLSGTRGWRSPTLTNLFAAPNIFWSMGPSVAETLFDGGARSAGVAQSQGSYQMAVAQYRQLSLTAMQQVEDQLAASVILSEEAALQKQAVAATARSLRLTTDQYKAGTVSFLNVVTAQTAAYTARNAALLIAGQRYTADVALIQALGGGWEKDALLGEEVKPQSSN